MTWQKMDTAPKDGSEIIAATPHGFAIVTWQDHQDDSPDQPGHNAGWASQCWAEVWPGRDKSGGFTVPDTYWSDPVNQPLRWQPIEEYPQDIDWDVEGQSHSKDAMNAIDKKAPQYQSTGAYTNWRSRGFPGLWTAWADAEKGKGETAKLSVAAMKTEAAQKYREE